MTTNGHKNVRWVFMSTLRSKIEARRTPRVLRPKFPRRPLADETSARMSFSVSKTQNQPFARLGDGMGSIAMLHSTGVTHDDEASVRHPPKTPETFPRF